MPTTKGAAPFPPVSYAAWRAGVEAELGSDGVSRRLRAMTEDGIAIEPLYAPGGPGDGEARNLAGRVAGLLPEGAGWRLRQRFPIDTSPEVLRAALAGGVQSLEFAGDGGEDPIGRARRMLGDLEPDLVHGVELSCEDVLPVEGPLAIDGAVSLGLDPIGRQLRRGGSMDQARAELDATAYPPSGMDARVKLFRATGESFFDAGGTTGLTLGATMAVALAYLRSFEAHRIDLSLAASFVEIRLPCGPRFFESAAMLRGARLVWARVLELAGITPAPLRLVASTGRRALTRHDPWNNALRNTSVAFAAAIGGADVLQLLPHDARTVDPGAAGLRLARTTGLILQEEAFLGRVLDPAAGSWFLESLTSELAEEAWDELRRLDAAGGIIAAIESGDLSRRIADASAARHDRVRDKRHPIIGVTAHPVEGEVVTGALLAEGAMDRAFPFRPDALLYEVPGDAEPAR